MTKFYITIGVVENDDIQQTVILTKSQINDLFDAIDADTLDELSTAVDKVQGDAKVDEHDHS